MFLTDAEANFGRLLQGDVIKDVPLVSTLALDRVQAVGQSAWAYNGSLKTGYCAVLSHSCEIAIENGEKVTSCILAPIRKADGATTPELFEILRRNEVKEGQSNFIKYFYIPMHEKLDYPRGSLVDLSKLFSVRKTSIEQLINGKILEMTDDNRVLFARKLALYFYRGP
ncbi:MAG: hypothetical protein KIT44_01890 [Opitutaceae bacterium]|nr:hypothetical protein [Opitutaceae bacterium]